MFSPIPGVLIQEDALEDLAQIAEYLVARNPKSGLRFGRSFADTIQTLADFPHSGAKRETSNPELHNLRATPVQGFKSYLIFYRAFASNNGLEILRVLHHSRDFESAFDGEE